MAAYGGRLGLIAALTLVSLAAMPVPAQACACAPVVAVPGQTVSFDREVAIFSATVVEQSLLKATVTLLVEQVWKGNVTRQITMRIRGFDDRAADNCEWNFEVGHSYVIFALGDSIETMRAEKCTRTARLEDAGEALEVLKAAGYRPRPPIR